MSEKPSEKSKKMTFTADMVREQTMEDVRELAKPVQPGESVLALIRKVSRVTGIPFSRVSDFWYGNPRAAVRGHELLTIGQKLYEKELQDRRKELERQKADHAKRRETFREENPTQARILDAVTRRLLASYSAVETEAAREEMAFRED